MQRYVSASSQFPIPESRVTNNNCQQKARTMAITSFLQPSLSTSTPSATQESPNPRKTIPETNSRASPENGQKMARIYIQNLSRLCPDYVQIMSRLCPESVQNQSRICPESVQNLSRICPESVQNQSRLCPESVQKMTVKWP